MSRIIQIFSLITLFFTTTVTNAASLSTTVSSTKQIPEQYLRGHVLRIIKEGISQDADALPFQTVEVRLSTGKTERINYTATDKKIKTQKITPGDEVVVLEIPSDTHEKSTFYITDFYRTPSLGFFALLFIVVVVALGKWRGVSSLFGLGTTIGVLIWFVIPQILLGHNPVIITLIGAPLIILLSMYLAHGWKKQTHLSVFGTILTLICAVLAALGAVTGARLFGTGSEEAMYVATSSATQIDLRGVLLAGIIIGALGVLDDITTAQTATIHEIHDTKPTIKFPELFMRAMRVGREHIASLVNTLVLAYAGASFPLFLLFFTTKEQQPLWVVLNSQQISEEIVRTLVGSVTLILAVPISSAISAWWYTRKTN